MKYAHLADLHLGSWRDQKMRDLSTKAFLTAIDQCISSKVDFILFAGDIFNTSLPSLDTLKIVTKKLKELKDQNIPLYVIAGSHDFSPSGKTMIDVLENAGLLKNVCKGKVNPETKELQLELTTDLKTGVKITGILGRKGLLDKTYYQNLDRSSLEQESGYKIFMFHTTLSELKPKHLEMLESQPASFLPKNFNYYAGGHIHHPNKIQLPEYGTLTYPGALFPNNFAEIEKYSHGGYYLINVENNVVNGVGNEVKKEVGNNVEKEVGNNVEKEVGNNVEKEVGNEVEKTIENAVENLQQDVQWIPLEVIKHQRLIFDCSHKTPEMIDLEIMDFFINKDLSETIVTIRLYGSLQKGKVSDINFKQITDKLYEQGAYFVMRNTSKLHSEEFEEIKISNKNAENYEEEIIKEHLQQIKLFDMETELQLTKSLLTALNTSKKEGETITDFNQRIIGEVKRLLNL